MLDSILMLIPTVLAILCLAVFNDRTRWLCYTLVVLSIASELTPLQVNAVGLAATCSALIALVVYDALHRMKPVKSTLIKQGVHHKI